MARLYVALIADAVASRALAPAARARLQTDVRAAMKDLNRRYRRVLVARFAVTLGDELQCRSEEHTSELQSRLHIVCSLLLEKKVRGIWVNELSFNRTIRPLNHLYALPL